MISARFGVVIALLLSLAALVLAVAALALALRPDDTVTGRLVQTRLTASFEGEPMLFPLDEFYFSRSPDGRVHALYTYPPGFFGHMRGCRVVWVPDERLDGVENADGPGLFVDPCGGARFSRDGRLLSGPAARGLDYFRTTPGVEGIVVDTRTLWCGRDFEPPPTPTPEPPPEPPEPPTPLPGAPSPTPAPPTETATATDTPRPTGTPDAARTATAAAGPAKCDRVTADSER